MSSIEITFSGLPPCSVSLLESQNLVVGTYDLNKETGKRTGSLDQYDCDLNLLNSVPLGSAILDTKLHEGKIYTAHSTGEVRVWDPVSFEQTSTIQLRAEAALITQIELNNESLAATTTEGELLIYDLQKEALSFESRLHDLEAWTVSWHSACTIFSGGDDRQFTYTDLRIPYTLWKIKSHEAGVTSILPDPTVTGSDNLVWTGGYDDTLNQFDLRTRRSQNSAQLSGGVWRLIPSPDKSRVLACCMYGGLQVLSSTHFGKVTNELTNHESMVYGGVWLNDRTGITCSFYDKMLQKWGV